MVSDEERDAHEDLVLRKPYLAQVEAGIRWWEQMRVWYNLILFSSGVLFSISLAGTLVLINPVFWLGAAFFGFCANVCYFLGPALDAYCYLFLKGRVQLSAMRMPIWIVGTMVSILVEIGVLLESMAFTLEGF